MPLRNSASGEAIDAGIGNLRIERSPLPREPDGGHYRGRHGADPTHRLLRRRYPSGAKHPGESSVVSLFRPPTPPGFRRKRDQRCRSARAARSRDGGRAEQRDQPAWRAGVPRSVHHRRTADGVQPPVRRVGDDGSSVSVGLCAAAGLAYRRYFESRSGQQGPGEGRPVAAECAGQPVMALRQQLQAGAGAVFPAVRSCDSGGGRGDAVRRYAGGLGCAAGADEGPAGRVGLRAYAVVLPCEDRLHRLVGGRAGENGAGAAGAGADASGRVRAEVAVPVVACRAASAAWRSRKRACC